MARKRLIESDEENYDSPRFNFRMNKDVMDIMGILDNTKDMDKSQFIREAIVFYKVFYWENRSLTPIESVPIEEPVKSKETKSPEIIPREEPTEPKKPETVKSSTWKAPWLSS
jgi:hypothetical protein